MKKIINGQRWDTEKATLVCDIFEGAVGDFRHFKAELYQTLRSKRFFLAGSGGPMTVFAHRCADGSTSGGSDIIPLSTEDARRYAEKYSSTEIVEKFFEVEEA